MEVSTLNQNNTGRGPSNRPQRPMFDQDGNNTAPPSGSGARNSSARPAPSERQVYRPAARQQQNRRPDNHSSARRQQARPAPTEGAYRTSSRTRKPKRRKRRAPIVVVTVLLVLTLGVLSLYAIIDGRISGEDTQAGTLPEEVKTLPEYSGKGIINILVCGIDYDDDDASGYLDENNKIGRTDVIMYVHYDTASGKVNILQIPRDTYVGSKVDTGGEGKINNVYYHAKDENNRMAALASVINDQLGLPIDYYITIDMDAFKEIIDIKGSIEVYVPVEVNDPRHNIALSPGWQFLGSDKVEFLVRNRYSTTYQDKGDIARLQTQLYFYSAMFREFKQLAPWDLVMWMNVLTYRCNTDMDLLQLGGLAQKALSVQSEDITFVRPAASGASYNGRSMVSLVPEETALLLNEYFRPEGDEKSLDELNIQTLPVIESIGTHEALIRTMSDVQESEGPREDASPTA